MRSRPLTQAVFCLACVVGEARGQGAPDDWVPSYYRRPSPDRFVEEVRGLAEAGVFDKENARPPMIGFFSQVMTQNPTHIEAWITDLQDLNEAGRNVLLESAWRSNTESAREYFRAAGLDEYLRRRAPDLLSVEVTDPSTLDMLWGHFYATGDEKSVRRIVSAFALSKHSGAIERFKQSSEKTDDEKREAYLEVVFKAARWSLESNCRQHPLVLEHCEKIYNDSEITKDEGLWLGVIMSKVTPDRYRLRVGDGQIEILEPSEL